MTTYRIYLTLNDCYSKIDNNIGPHIWAENNCPSYKDILAGFVVGRLPDTNHISMYHRQYDFCDKNDAFLFYMVWKNEILY